MHDVVIVGVPLVAILAGILFNRGDIRDLLTEIKDLRNEVRSSISNLRTEAVGRLDLIDSDIRQFYHLTAN